LGKRKADAVVNDAPPLFRRAASCCPPSVGLVVNAPQIHLVAQHPHGHDRECEDLGARLEMAAERIFAAGHGHSGVDPAVDGVSIHRHDVGRPRRVLDAQN
jgi:hypothetical protein